MNQSEDNPPTTQGAQQGELFADAEETPATAQEQHEFGEVRPVRPQSIEAIITEFKKLVRPVQAVAAVRAGVPDSPEKLEAALDRLPRGDIFGRTIDDLRTQATEAIARARRERVEAFRHVETEFLRGVVARGEPFREQANGWRVGRLELEVRREQAQCRWLYNHEALIEWSRVASVDDLERTREKSLEFLKRVALPESLLKDAFWDAYQECLRLRHGRSANPDLVPLLDLYRELRLTLVRRDLAQSPEKALSYSEFRRWAFLYNLDLYRGLSSTVPIETRLAVQTGSQQETRRLGMVVGGLDPSRDYAVVCYVAQG